MRTFDPTPLWRSTVGFDRLFDLIDSCLPGDDNYPPYNIERTGEDIYHILLALAGFTPDEVTVMAEQNMLTVEGYEPIARPIFQRIHATRLLLEYDDDRSGSFAPLRHVPDDKTVVLGLISTRRRQMEAPEDLIRRITEG